GPTTADLACTRPTNTEDLQWNRVSLQARSRGDITTGPPRLNQ
ncbi:hypothetical protein AVEN_13215-1, partial [Araneus ventricosus]